MEHAIRSTEIDCIRLSALLGICVVNLPFMGVPIAETFAAPASWQDRSATFFVAAFFQVKFFLLFAFVFGWSVAIQAKAMSSLSLSSFKRQYFRRQLGLALLGSAHALLVFTGDILLIYAIAGFFLWPLRGKAPGELFKIAIIAIGVSMLALVVLAFVVDELLSAGGPASLEGIAGLGGSYTEATLARLQNWPGTLGFLILLQGPLVFAAFCLGVASVKVCLFEPGSAAFVLLARRVPWLLVIALPANSWYAITVNGLWPNQPEGLQLLGFIAIAIGGPTMAACYLVATVKLARRFSLPEVMIQAGRNSLSTYVLQGVIAGWVFGGYGLGLFNQLDAILLIPLSLLIALLAIVLIGVYARWFGKGPLEPLLRKMARLPISK